MLAAFDLLHVVVVVDDHVIIIINLYHLRTSRHWCLQLCLCLPRSSPSRYCRPSSSSFSSSAYSSSWTSSSSSMMIIIFNYQHNYNQHQPCCKCFHSNPSTIHYLWSDGHQLLPISFAFHPDHLLFDWLSFNTHYRLVDINHHHCYCLSSWSFADWLIDWSLRRPKSAGTMLESARGSKLTECSTIHTFVILSFWLTVTSHYPPTTSPPPI